MDNYSIYKILEKIKKRPGMYTGDLTLKSIRTYLDGYEMAMYELGVENISTPAFGDFHEFVRKKFNYYEATAGWANMILAVTIGLDPENICWEGYDKGVTFEQHKESVTNFYKYLNEFRESSA